MGSLNSSKVNTSFGVNGMPMCVRNCSRVAYLTESEVWAVVHHDGSKPQFYNDGMI